jgi:hypothetical protein
MKKTAENGRKVYLKAIALLFRVFFGINEK